jgi:hypothetical protein
MRFKLLLFLVCLCLAPCVLAQGSHRIGQVLVKGNGINANVGLFANITVCVSGTGCVTAAEYFLPANRDLTHDVSVSRGC